MQSYKEIMKTKSNSIKDIKEYICNELKNKYSDNEIKSLTNILFKEYAYLDAAYLLAFENDTINESSLLNIVLATQRLKKHEPIQYIIGKTDFLNIKLEINSNVLIPRPETEEMAQIIIQENQRTNLKIIDICAGSGCIALALNKNIPQSNVIGTDISPKAIETAKKNNEINNLNTKFYLFDFLSITDNENNQIDCKNNQLDYSNNQPDCFNDKFDIIVSNPPYVMEKEKSAMQKNVLNYEPSIALYVKDENPLIFYKKLVFFASKHLKTCGKMYLEVNASLANDTCALFSNSQFITEVREDIFNKKRFLFLQKKA